MRLCFVRLFGHRGAERICWLITIHQLEGAHLFQTFLGLRHDPANIGFLLVAELVTIFAKDGSDLHLYLRLGRGAELGHGGTDLGVQRWVNGGGLRWSNIRESLSRQGFGW